MLERRFWESLIASKVPLDLVLRMEETESYGRGKGGEVREREKGGGERGKRRGGGETCSPCSAGSSKVLCFPCGDSFSSVFGEEACSEDGEEEEEGQIGSSEDPPSEAEVEGEVDVEEEREEEKEEE